MVRVSGVRFTPRTVKMKVNGIPVTNRIRVRSRVPYVGHYKRKENVVLVDSKLKGAGTRRAVAVHESVERYLRYKKHLPKTKAHKQAERVEYRYAQRIRLNWKKHGDKVEKVWRKNRRKGQRRRR